MYLVIFSKIINQVKNYKLIILFNIIEHQYQKFKINCQLIERKFKKSLIFKIK